jgi:hypothetical protein
MKQPLSEKQYRQCRRCVWLMMADEIHPYCPLPRCIKTEEKKNAGESAQAVQTPRLLRADEK